LARAPAVEDLTYSEFQQAKTFIEAWKKANGGG
jgi:hypothetical protein